MPRPFVPRTSEMETEWQYVSLWCWWNIEMFVFCITALSLWHRNDICSMSVTFHSNIHISKANRCVSVTVERGNYMGSQRKKCVNLKLNKPTFAQDVCTVQHTVILFPSACLLWYADWVQPKYLIKFIHNLKIVWLTIYYFFLEMQNHLFILSVRT